MIGKLMNYFSIEASDTKHIQILNDILSFVEDYMVALGIDLTESNGLAFLCCVDLYSNYLKTGNDQYQTANAPTPQDFSPATLQMLHGYARAITY